MYLTLRADVEQVLSLAIAFKGVNIPAYRVSVGLACRFNVSTLVTDKTLVKVRVRVRVRLTIYYYFILLTKLFFLYVSINRLY